MINRCMNYEKHYSTLMERSRTRTLTGYVEKHHILPRCLGGTDEIYNIAVLTPEEHFVAHQLLIKMHPGNRDLIYAAQLMTVHHTGARANNKLFGWLRKQCARAMSVQTKKWIAENGHPKGMLGKRHTVESNKRRSIACKAAMTESIGVAIYAFNMDGTFFKQYTTITECAADLKTSPSNVKYTADGKFGHCKGKQLRYEMVPSVDSYVSPFAGVKKETYTCPHCGKQGAGPAMPRWHFDNCKVRK